MKRFAVVFSGPLLAILISHAAFAQAKKEPKSAVVKSQIKPKFSEMVDYGLPASTGVHDLPGGKAPASNQINPDGSVKVSRTDEIIVPSDSFMKIKREKSKEDVPQIKQQGKKSVK